MEQPWAVILAAGEGTRMQSAGPKVMHPLCGRPLLWHVLEAARVLTKKQVLVTGRGAALLKDYFGDGYTYVEQAERLGTGHALQQVLPQLPAGGDVLVLCGDTPLLDSEVLGALLADHRRQGAAATVLTAALGNPHGYGRVIRDERGRVQEIVEDRHLRAGQEKINEINTGCYCFAAQALHALLPRLPQNKVTGEYYLTDLLPLLKEAGHRVAAFLTVDAQSALGINDRAQLAVAAARMRERINRRLMLAGVTMLDPETTYLDVDVAVGRDTVLYPHCIFEGQTVVGENCVLGPGLHLVNTAVENDVTCRQGLVIDSSLGAGANIGPYVHIRPGSSIGAETRIGNFVEVKNSSIGKGSKVPHLSYIGDTQMEESVNMGAGSIVVNYDGRRKHLTQIEAGAFVGCNSNLIAPLKIGRGAFIAAGSTITRDVPPGALVVARPQEKVKKDLAKKFLKGRPKKQGEK
ncbi:MAG: bifunctional UDP-N-acetylglucosamine diphosphorylase/glucosamine-1-phosphate N-acetyltransferase GlmU [Firmicutes bacterium]|nr:bifunctional UDP-N-acetylglucosamine diphosphorylase/glucosamine-1-phosphate N-acetyltransferase GlmU [Bacillota bacterium]